MSGAPGLVPALEVCEEPRLLSAEGGDGERSPWRRRWDEAGQPRRPARGALDGFGHRGPDALRDQELPRGVITVPRLDRDRLVETHGDVSPRRRRRTSTRRTTMKVYIEVPERSRPRTRAVVDVDEAVHGTDELRRRVLGPARGRRWISVSRAIAPSRSRRGTRVANSTRYRVDYLVRGRRDADAQRCRSRPLGDLIGQAAHILYSVRSRTGTEWLEGRGRPSHSWARGGSRRGGTLPGSFANEVCPGSRSLYSTLLHGRDETHRAGPPAILSK